MSGCFSRMIVLAAILPLLASACQPIEDAPLDLRAPAAPEETPDLSAYAIETLPELEETGITVTATASTDSPASTLSDGDNTVTSGEISSAVELAQVITPAPDPEPAPPPQLEPATLIGSSPDRLLLRLGEPDYLRKEGQVEIWQYRLVTCVVNFVLKDEGKGRMLTAWIGRHRQLGLPYDHDACIKDLGAKEQL